MSSTYALFSKRMTTTKDGEIVNSFDESDYVVIGRTSNFTLEGHIIQKHLKNTTPVYCIDNCTRVKNIEDLRKYYKDFNKEK